MKNRSTQKLFYLYYNVPLWAFILISVFSCKYEPYCGEDGGTQIKCFDNNGQEINDYCTKRDPPPCQCKDKDGKDQLKEFDLACRGGVGVGVNIEVIEPYDFSCDIGTDYICTEFDTYFVDFTGTGEKILDRETRPFYSEFSIQNFDIENFNYKIEVRDLGTGNTISQGVISKDNLDNPLLRKLTPESCMGSPCTTKGVYILNLQHIGDRSSSINITLYGVSRENQATSEIATKVVQIRNFDLRPSDISRVLDLLVYKTKSNDLRTYGIGTRSFEEAMEHTFGLNKSNLRFNVPLSKLIGSPYVDNSNNIMLNARSLPDNLESKADFGPALREWSLRTYRKDLEGIENAGFSMEAMFMDKYDFRFNPPKADLGDFIVAAKMFYDASGVTLSSAYNGIPFYNGSVIFRSNTPTLSQDSEESFKNDLVTRTFLHEVGHMWSNQGYKSTEESGCLKHTSYCKGKNYYTCLWRTSCVGVGNNESLDDYLLSNINNPTFCEGHQQIFMNSLTPLK